MTVGHPAVSASDPIVYIDRSEIREGSLEELRAGSNASSVSSKPGNLG
jgi:hypothetical protein